MTKAYERAKMRMPLRLQLRRFAHLGFMALVVALIPVCLCFLSQESSSNRFTGVVESDSETAGAVAAARVASIDVQLGQRVEPGDVLARLDPADRTLDLAMQEARLADYEQRVMRYEQSVMNYRQTLEESERRCRQVVQEASVALEEARMNRGRDQAELSGLKAEIARLQPLVDRHLVSEIELSSLRPKVQALEQTAAHYEPLIAALKTRWESAVADLKEVRGLLAAQGTNGAPAQASMLRVAQTYRQAATNNNSFVLRAARAGVVSRIQHRAGDVVVAGEPIVRVAAETSVYITGLLTQQQVAGLAVGDRMKVCPVAGDACGDVWAEVESVDPEVLDLIDPFNLAPRCPVRGRRVRLRLADASHALIPGETVVLRPVKRATWRERIRRFCPFSGRRPAAF